MSVNSNYCFHHCNSYITEAVSWVSLSHALWMPKLQFCLASFRALSLHKLDFHARGTQFVQQSERSDKDDYENSQNDKNNMHSIAFVLHQVNPRLQRWPKLEVLRSVEVLHAGSDWRP